MNKKKITTGAFPKSKKVYVHGSLFDIKVPMREISLSVDNLNKCGSKHQFITVYDTSGPYTDPEYTVDLEKGLPLLRDEWVLERGVVDVLKEPGSIYGKKSLKDKSLDDIRHKAFRIRPYKAQKGKAKICRAKKNDNTGPVYQ